MASKTTIEIDAGDPGENDSAIVFVFDRRRGNAPEKKIALAGLFDYNAFKLKIIKEFGLTEKDHFVIVTTTRQEVTGQTYENLVEDRDTLYLLFSVKQELSAPAQERVDYQPHYDTLVKSGMYEYYASEGQNPLPFAFAELIDNSLAATCNNVGTRRIELKLYFDETMGKNMIVVSDNGQGMTSRALQNWAVYRLSKFIRKDKSVEKNMEGETSHQVIMPRSLNSDISYFGVGGKQAAFFIGCSTVMISKPKGSKDVHEFTVSKEEFERRERMKESIYRGYIHNRKPGDISHVPPESQHMQKLIKDELGQESFTNIAISGIENRHIQYLKTDFIGWCKQLAHIYHYYIHGPKGNEERSLSSHQRAPSPFKNLDIDIALYEKGKPPREQNLRDINSDQQTNFIRSSADCFEFRAKVEGTGMVEGILRYHPFLYDKETYPSNTPYRIDSEVINLEEELEFYVQDRPARGNRPIFECYWNGRLIPYTFVQDFGWCSPPKKRGPIPVECYNRLSGALWTNDKFQVSTNKLTFTDLEVRLRDNSTIFEKVIGGQPQRANIDREFTEWLKECHRKLDKQIKFTSYSGKTCRTELPLKRQSPWAVYKSIEWDGKTFKVGQLVRTIRTVPIIYGSIQKFMLFGDHNDDVFATGGEVEIRQEPAMLYDLVKSFPLSKLDRVIQDRHIKKYIDDESGKLPEKLTVSWPESFDVLPNEKRPAGKKIGAIQVEILNRNGDAISRLPGSQHSSKRLLVELKMILHAPSKDEEIVSYISQYGKKWSSFWFRKMENVKTLGNYTLKVQCVMNESNAESFGGKPLPSHKIKFSVVEGPPAKFSVGMLEPPFRVGVPFNIPLKVHDEFGNQTKPTPNLKPVLEASGIKVDYGSTVVKGSTLIIKDVKAIASVDTATGKDYSFNITLPSLETPCQTMKFRLLPGPASSIYVSNMLDEDTELENGKPLVFNIEIRDAAGNITAQPKLNVVCKLYGGSGLPTYNTDCSNTGKGTLSGNILYIKNIKKPQKILARIELPNFKHVPSYEKAITIIPSCQPCYLDVFFTKSNGKLEKLLPQQELECTAGEHMNDLMFALFDEGKRHLGMTRDLADKIKVSWLPRCNKDQLMEGRLPSLKIPDSILDPKYCEVSLSDGSGVEFSFTVKPTAGAAALLKATVKGSKNLRLGEVWDGEIIISVTDEHSNPIKKLPHGALSQLEITAENLNTKQLQRALLQNVGFVLKNIRFTGEALGQREITLRYCGLTDYVKLSIDAGLPTKLSFLHFDPARPIVIHTDSWLGKPVSLQLTDEVGNAPTNVQLKATMHVSSGFQLNPTPKEVSCDKKGVINFGEYKVTAGIGTYRLTVKASIGKSSVTSPTLTVRVSPDPKKPVSVAVAYTDKKVTAGNNLPDFGVRVVTEDKGSLQNINPKSVSMVIRRPKEDLLGGVAYTSDGRRPSDDPKQIYFRNHKAPETSGPCYISFRYSSKYNNKDIVIQSQEFKISVISGHPVKLVSDTTQPTPTVSNSPRPNTRVLIDSLALQLRDEYDNPTGEDINGKVSVTVSGSIAAMDDDDLEIPCLDQSSSNLSFPMTKGFARIENVTIEANSPGKDGAEYVVKMAVTASKLHHRVKPFFQPFLFYNDARKQLRMSSLSKERDTHVSAIKAYKELFETIDQLVKEMKNAHSEALDIETQTKRELQQMNIPAQQLRSDISISNLIAELSLEKESYLRRPRRRCGLENVQIRDSLTLGKIAHLAEIEDDNIAFVLSWHMAGDMDCVITKTTARAKEIYDESKGSQQVLPLDSIFKKNLSDWNKSLPHTRFKKGNNPPGNPIYARHLLKFSAEEEDCKLVFLMLLRDTIVLDTLEDANKYRTELIKFSHCPTLLTRNGNRVQSNGKFGGNQNRAPSIDAMRGAVFGAPVPQAYNNLCNKIEKLTFYKSAVMKRSQTQQELKEAEARRNDADVKTQMRECQEAEEQLVLIEEKLGMTSSNNSASNSRGRQSQRGRPDTQNRQELLQRRLNSTPPAKDAVSVRSSGRRTGGTPVGSPPETKRRR